jgi:hypothetical protein
VPTGDVARLQPFSIIAAATDIPKVEHLLIEVRDANGHRVSENSYDLFLFPKPVENSVPLLFSDELLNSSLHDRLAKAGYEIGKEGDDDAILIASTHDPAIDSHLSRGGRVFMVINSEAPLPSQWNIVSKTRSGSDLDGRWISNYNWIRLDRPPYSSVPFKRILGFEAAKVIPRYVLQQIQACAYEDVLCGITYGWLNKNAALTAQMRIGAGKLIATTFCFDAYGSDPYATYLLDSFLRYMDGPDFNPLLNISKPTVGLHSTMKQKSH